MTLVIFFVTTLYGIILLVYILFVNAAIAVEGGGGETAETEEEQQLSALRENLARKGKNSYYYAHGRCVCCFLSGLFVLNSYSIYAHGRCVVFCFVLFAFLPRSAYGAATQQCHHHHHHHHCCCGRDRLFHTHAHTRTPLCLTALVLLMRSAVLLYVPSKEEGQV